MGLSREQVMNLIERLYTMWNSQNLSMAAEIYTADYYGLDVTDQSHVNGLDGIAQQLVRFYRAFPDLVFTNEETICENDRVALYWTARGTHQGTLMNIPPTGRTVQVNGTSILRVVDGKFARGVHLWDLAGLLRDIGLLPELAQRLPLDALSLKNALTVCD